MICVQDAKSPSSMAAAAAVTMGDSVFHMQFNLNSAFPAAD